jgi:hypothetical protein
MTKIVNSMAVPMQNYSAGFYSFTAPLRQGIFYTFATEKKCKNQ